MVRTNIAVIDGFDGQTVSAAIQYASDLLRQSGCPDPATDARKLMSAATRRSSAKLISHDDYELIRAEAQRFDEFVVRRCAREPVSRILGEREFYGRKFEISPATLDPRPDTETLIDAALDIVEKNNWRDVPIRILDVGTGSGCLIVTLLAELDHAVAQATDVSQEALFIARQNAERHNVASRINFAKTHALTGIEPPFHMIVSNPPYIPSQDIPHLDREVSEYDPQLALDGGVDGLDIYRELAPEAARVAPGGCIVMEVGAGQADAVSKIFADEGLKEQQSYVDLGGHTRCVAAWTQD